MKSKKSKNSQINFHLQIFTIICRMAAPAFASAAPKVTLEIDGSDQIFSVLGELDGGTAPRLVSRDSDGVRFVLKLTEGAHEANEYLAFQLYKAVGCNVPDTYLVKDKVSGIYGLLESFIHGVTLYDLMHIRDPKVVELTFPVIQRDLVIHALFANWDINVTTNIMIPYTKEGTPDYANPIVIDCGGTLQFRAMGGLKEFTSEVGNIKSIVRYAQNYKPFGKFKRVAEAELNAVVCERWRTVKKYEILKAFDTTRPKIEPIFRAAGLSLDTIRSILEARMTYLDRLCPAPAGGRRSRKHRNSRRRNTYRK
jgi:hypothetical protein